MANNIIGGSLPASEPALTDGTVTIGTGAVSYDVTRRGYASGTYGSISNTTAFTGLLGGRTYTVARLAVSEGTSGNTDAEWILQLNLDSGPTITSNLEEFSKLLVNSRTLSWSSATKTFTSTVMTFAWQLGDYPYDNLSSSGTFDYEIK